MPTVHFLLPDSTVRRIEIEPGISLMRAAVENSVPGIVGECGGSAMCGTCHVYVDAGFVDRVPAPDMVENEMLEALETERRATSRLSCQILVSEELEGLTVEVPAA